MMIFKLAWRSLWRNRRRTLITLSSIGFGLTLAIFFISLSAGIHKQVVGDATSMLAGHLAIEHASYRDAPATDLKVDGVEALAKQAAAVPGVEHVKRLVQAQAVVSTGSGSVGVSVLGVDPKREALTSPLARKLVQGRYLDDGDERGVLVGRRLAERLELEPGKKLVASLSGANGEMVKELLRVVGIFETGADELDGFVIQVPLPVARHLVGLGDDEVTQMGVLLRSPDDQEAVRAQLAPLVAGRNLAVRGWQELLPELSGWNTLDGSINRVLCGVILFLILFTILNTLLMSVLERSREFAILLALGTPPTLLRLQVLAEAALLGALGCLVGLVLGGTAGYLMETRGLDLSHLTQGQSVGGFAFDMRIRGDVTATQLVTLGALVFGATALLSLYPIIRSTRVAVADVLRSR
ncbi:MAG TPA: ABC transporter permease [Myxococcus sp.]|nr:ABC transporter permease [Myxococcus sp.]